MPSDRAARLVAEAGGSPLAYWCSAGPRWAKAVHSVAYCDAHRRCGRTRMGRRRSGWAWRSACSGWASSRWPRRPSGAPWPAARAVALPCWASPSAPSTRAATREPLTPLHPCCKPLSPPYLLRICQVSRKGEEAFSKCRLLKALQAMSAAFCQCQKPCHVSVGQRVS